VGTFDNGETEQCSDCVGDTYTDQPGLTVCAGCGSDSASHNKPHVACQCNRGFFLEEGGCAGCATNFFKDATGNQACTPCQPDSQSAGSATSQSDCLCNNGYHQEGESTCVACATGKFADTLMWLCVGGVILVNSPTRWRSLCVYHAGKTRGTTTRTQAACATVATLPGTKTRAGRVVATHSRTSRATLSAAAAGTILNPRQEQ